MTAARRAVLDRLPLALRFALRDLLGDPRGFGVFIACIVIGVAAISGVGGLSRALSQGLAKEGRTILGGDISFNLAHRELEPKERAWLAQHGRIDAIALMRAMAKREGASEEADPALVELKAVDPSVYPAFGALETEPRLPILQALAVQGEVFGLIADPLLIARLDAKIGDRLTIGAARFEIRAILRGEPDKLSGGVGFGSRVLISFDGLKATGLVQPGTIVRYIARLALPGNPSEEEVTALADAAGAAFPLAGWDIRKRDAASPQFSRNLERFSQLLTLVALTALVAGGAGVANAVQGLIERKRAAFAILKALGAPATRVFAIALSQVLLMAMLAIGVGLVAGAAIPYLGGEALRRAIDLPVVVGIDGAGLAIGALYGLLVTLVFSLGPLGATHSVPVAALLRGDAESSRENTPLRYRLAGLSAMLALIATVLLSASDKKLAAYFLAAVLAAFLLLRGVAFAATWAARKLPRAGDARLRLAQSNIARKGGLAPALILSIGVTVTLLVALALVEGAIHAELARSGSGEIPRFYFIDVPQNDSAAFESFLAQQVPASRVNHMPMMRGRVVAVKGARVETLHVGDDAAWALDGDRGVTFAAAPPQGARIVEGAWWEADTKAPLVSLEAKVAKGLGLVLGDEITVNVLGREINARVANLRHVEWRSYAINFVMVFSPASFQGAPYSELFTIGYDVSEGRPSQAAAYANADALDAGLARETAKRFPMVASVRVKDALEAVDKIAGQLALAARAAAGVAIVTAMLALGSAVAAGQRGRQHDAVVLKTLGATRRWLMAAYALEFGLLGVVACLFAVLAGSAAAFAIVDGLMKMSFVFLPGTVAATTFAALAATMLLGLAGTWRALARKPGPELRSL
jgi:putative ABC transport system permease protein